MFFYAKDNRFIILVVVLFLIPFGFGRAQEEVVDLQFEAVSNHQSGTSGTRLNIVKVRDISEAYSTGGVYFISGFGDCEDLFQKENQKAIEDPMIEQSWRYCSLFSSTEGDTVLMGRNWDNQNVGSILISLYRPANGYASISFSRAIDLGFPLNVDLEGIGSGEFGSRLRLAPFYAMDGINERGVSVATAGVRQTGVKADSGRQSVFITFLIRKILNEAKNIQEAVNLAQSYAPFDLKKGSLNCHLLLSDASGGSVILEYAGGQWQAIYKDKSWQILTNKPVFDVSDETLKSQCWRFKRLSGSLQETNGKVNWRRGLKMLKSVSQKGTTWSVVYLPTVRELYFSVYQSWDKIYHLKIPASE